MLQPGDEIDIWVIERRLGSGGMGSVYRCHNRGARRILAAIKVLEGAIARHPEARARFVREAEILFTIDHPNIVKVRNIRVEADTPYIEMQFVEGRSLEDTLAADGGLDLSAAIPLMQQMASALTYLHKQGIRHRDMKPANLLITEDKSIKLVDFGLAMEAGTSRLTQGNASFGTVSYAPPEWVDPVKLDPVQWDLYGMGVVFWEMLTGAVAFPVSGSGSARQQAMQVILNKQNHPPLDPGPSYPMMLRELIGELTRSDSSERLADAQIALDRLNELASQPIQDVHPLRPLRTLTPDIDDRRADATIVPRDAGNTFAMDESERANMTAPTAIREISPVDLGGHRSSDGPAPRPSAASPLHQADTILEAQIEPRRGSGARLGVVAVILVVVGMMAVLAIGVAAIAVAMWPEPPPVVRDASVILQGVPDGTAVSLAVDGTPVAAGTGLTRALPGLSLGSHELQWAVGEGCDAVTCALSCPDWCLSGKSAVTMQEGKGAQQVSLRVAVPKPRAIRVGTSAMPADTPVDIVIDGIDGQMDGVVYRASAVPPGPYVVIVTVGTCDDDQPPCEDDCPVGCRRVVRSLAVGVGQARLEARLAVKAPTVKQAIRRPPTQRDDPPAGTEPVDDPPDPPDLPDDPPPTGTAAPLVTAAQYASWLSRHPEWTRTSAIASGTADQNYLYDWRDGKPPPAKGGLPVEAVSHLAARAYCQGRGGLPQLTDAPTGWDETTVGLGFEWRLSGSAPARLESTGSTSTVVGRKQALVGTGFRCKR